MNKKRSGGTRVVLLALLGGVIVQTVFAKHRVVVMNGSSSLTSVRLRIRDREADIGAMGPSTTKEARIQTSAKEGALSVRVERESGVVEEECAYATRLPRHYIVQVDPSGIRCRTVGPWPFFF